MEEAKNEKDQAHKERLERAAKEKDLGNEAFQGGRFEEAIAHFTAGIELDPYNHVLFSNRSAAYASLNDYQKSLADADKTINLKPNWIKGYTRKATAHFFMEQYSEAASAYIAGMEYEPNSDVLREGLQGVIEKVEATEVLTDELPQREATTTAPSIPKGVWIPILVPYTQQNKINWIAVDQLVESFVSKGAAGIFALTLSSESFELKPEERIHFVRRIVKAARGRISVIAVGNFGQSLEEQVKAVKDMYNTGVDAVAVMVSMLAKQSDSEETWKGHCQSLLDATGNIPFGLYECPKPTPFSLSPDTLKWAVKTGRFHFIFDNSPGQQALQEKYAAVADTEAFRFFPTSSTLLCYSLQLGVSGLCDVTSNLYPDLFVYLFTHFHSKPQQATIVAKFLVLAQAVLEPKYPQSAKYFLRLFEKGFAGVIEGASRVAAHDFNEDDAHRMGSLAELIALVRSELKDEAKGSKAKPVLM